MRDSGSVRGGETVVGRDGNGRGGETVVGRGGGPVGGRRQMRHSGFTSGNGGYFLVIISELN